MKKIKNTFLAFFVTVLTSLNLVLPTYAEETTAQTVNAAGFSVNVVGDGTVTLSSGDFTKTLSDGESYNSDYNEGTEVKIVSNGKAKYIIAVHTNTNNIHAHIAVDKYLKDGKVWDIYWKRDQKRFREISDRICVKHGFSVLEETRNRSQTYFEWLGEHSDNNRDVIKKIMDTVIPKVASYNYFKNYM